MTFFKYPIKLAFEFGLRTLKCSLGFRFKQYSDWKWSTFDNIVLKGYGRSRIRKGAGICSKTGGTMQVRLVEILRSRICDAISCMVYDKLESR